jgi:uncharacterized RDD family membrane protein YckC
MADYQFKNMDAKSAFKELLIIAFGSDPVRELQKIKEILRVEPDIEDPFFFYCYGNALHKTGEYEKARVQYLKCIELDEKYPLFEQIRVTGFRVNGTLGAFAHEIGEYAEAKAYYEKALEYRDDQDDEQCRKIRALLKQTERKLMDSEDFVRSETPLKDNTVDNTLRINNTHRHSVMGDKQQYVGFYNRVLAFVLDILFLYVPVGILLRGAKLDAFGVLTLFLTIAIICAFWVKWEGRTPGKRILGTRVVKYPDEGTLEPRNVLLRALGYILDYVTAGIGFIFVLFREDRRALHDLIAQTCVIHDKSDQSKKKEGT